MNMTPDDVQRLFEMGEDNRTIIVNLFAGPGAGKSTTAAGVFHHLKKKGVDCELITEFAKDLTWEERHGALSVQPYVFGKQLMKIERVMNKVDVLIVDSPLLLSIIYNENWGDTFNDMVVEIFYRYRNLNFFLERGKPYNPMGRNHTESEAKEIDKKILHLMNTHLAPFGYFTVSYDNAIKVIESEIEREKSSKNLQKRS